MSSVDARPSKLQTIFRQDTEKDAVGGLSVPPDGGGGCGAGGGSDEPEPVYRRRSGDAASRPVSAPVVAAPISALATADGEADGFDCRYNAAAPAVSAAEADVELLKIPTYPLFEVEETSAPGAKRSTQLPRLDHDPMASFVFVDPPTVIAPATLAGEIWQASSPAFPAAAVTVTPALMTLVTA